MFLTPPETDRPPIGEHADCGGAIVYFPPSNEFNTPSIPVWQCRKCMFLWSTEDGVERALVQNEVLVWKYDEYTKSFYTTCVSKKEAEKYEKVTIS